MRACVRACARALECVWVGMFECMCLRFVVVVGTRIGSGMHSCKCRRTQQRERGKDSRRVEGVAGHEESPHVIALHSMMRLQVIPCIREKTSVRIHVLMCVCVCVCVRRARVCARACISTPLYFCIYLHVHSAYTGLTCIDQLSELLMPLDITTANANRRFPKARATETALSGRKDARDV